MPYYKDLHTLFIHIPKTGGSTLEKVLRQEGNHKQTLYSSFTNTLLPEPYNKTSLQHQSYCTILDHKELCDIDFNEQLKLLTIVRNPYHRAVSSLFFHNYHREVSGVFFHNKKMKKRTTKAEVFEELQKFIDLPNDKVDNHNVPQYKFVVDKNNKLPDKLIILRTESLDRDMMLYFKRIVCEREQVGKASDTNYMKYLGPRSIKLINRVYKRDFELFNYPMKKI